VILGRRNTCYPERFYPMAAKIHIERMMYRNSVSVPGETAASYALVKLIPTSDSSARPLGLNLAIVLDVSGSMYEEDGTGKSRLKRVQEAALAGIRRLRDDDRIAIIAFAQNAQVVLPATSLAERSKVA